MVIDPFVLISAIISIISTISAVFFAIKAYSNTKTKDDKKEATEMTTVIVKLENIDKTTTRIETDLKDVKDTVNSHTKQIIRLEERIKYLENKGSGKDE